MNFDNIDKTLITEGVLYFSKDKDNHQLKLADDGLIEIYHNDKLENTFPFSKVGLIRECKNLSQKEYTLTVKQENINNDNKENNDIDMSNPEQTKQNLQQDIKDVEEIKKLKDELDDKVNEIMEEDKKPDEPFPSTEFTNEPIDAKDLNIETFNNNLTTDQKIYINTYIGTIDDLVNALKDLYNDMGKTIRFTLSLDEYIEEVLNCNEDNLIDLYEETLNIKTENKSKFFTAKNIYDDFIKEAKEEAEDGKYSFKISDTNLPKEECTELKNLLLQDENIKDISYDPVPNLYTITFDDVTTNEENSDIEEVSEKEEGSDE